MQSLYSRFEGKERWKRTQERILSVINNDFRKPVKVLTCFFFPATVSYLLFSPIPDYLSLAFHRNIHLSLPLSVHFFSDYLHRSVNVFLENRSFTQTSPSGKRLLSQCLGVSSTCGRGSMQNAVLSNLLYVAFDISPKRVRFHIDQSDMLYFFSTHLAISNFLLVFFFFFRPFAPSPCDSFYSLFKLSVLYFLSSCCSFLSAVFHDIS